MTAGDVFSDSAVCDSRPLFPHVTDLHEFSTGVRRWWSVAHGMSVVGGIVWVMDEQLALLQQAADLLQRALQTPLVMAADEPLCEFTVRVEAVGRLVDALRVSTAGEIDERSRYELGRAGLASRNGHPRSVHFIEELTRVSEADVARRIRLGAALRSRTTVIGEALPARYPAVADAVASGTIGLDAAAHIVWNEPVKLFV